MSERGSGEAVLGSQDWSLRIVSGPAAGSVIALGEDGVTFARERPCAPGLAEDLDLSRRHARISLDGSAAGPAERQAVVEDLGSTNGTLVNGLRIDAPTPIGPNDVVLIGSSEIVVVAPAVAAGGQATVIRKRAVGEAAGGQETVIRGRTGEPQTGRAGPAGARAEEPGPERRGPLSRVASLTTRRPKRVLGVFAALFAIAIPLGGPVVAVLKDHDGFVDPASETAHTRDLLNRASGAQGNGQLVALVSVGAGPGTAAAQAKVARVSALISAKSEGMVRSIATYNGTHSAALLSKDGKSQLVAVVFRDLPVTTTSDAGTRIADALAGEPGVKVGGSLVAGDAIGKQVGMDIGKAEGIAFPILFIVSLFVFRGVIAALLPLFVGFITILLTLLVLRLVNFAQPLSPFITSIVIGLGLGLAIDYSLLMVSRYREELAREGAYPGASSESQPDRAAFAALAATALRRSLLTAGRTILFSALTVAAALASLIVFRQPFLYSMGLGGAITALLAAGTALLALPALLILLGPHINSLAPARWQRSALRTAQQQQAGFWYRESRWVMRHPASVALCAAAALLVMAVPAFRIHFTGTDVNVLPSSNPARQVSEAQHRDFPGLPGEPERLAVFAPAGAGARVSAYARGLAARADVAQVGAPRPLRGGVWEVDAIPRYGNLDTRTLDLVRSIRARGSLPLTISVTGPAAEFLDERHSIATHLPLALILLVCTTVIALFLMTGSVVLPAKAILMNLLSIGAAMGLLVLIFQDGRLEGPLGFQSPHALDLSQPVLLFALAFGLSTDYATILLTRIKEARDHGASDAEAVAIGLERTGRIVTQAAVLFCIAIGAFALSKVVFIKEVGLGTALAVLLDATIVRALLVPSLMVMLGRWNWWAPAPLRRLHDRLGLDEG